MKTQKNIVYIAIFSAFVVGLWIALSLYNSFTTSTISDTINIQIKPLNPSFNTGVVNSLKSRQSIPVDLTQQLSSESAQTPTPTPFISTPQDSSVSGQTILNNSL